MELFLAIILMIIGMILLIKGSDIFVDVGTHIGKMFKMSEILIGLTIVCVGTSLPELLLSISASFNDTSDFLIGNIVGTNIFNMCCILGVICLMNPLKLLRQTIRKDMNMSLVASLALLALLIDSSNGLTISRSDGIILLLFFAIFMYYTLYEFGEYFRDLRERKYKDKKQNKVRIENKDKKMFSMKDMKKLGFYVLIALLSIAAIYFGAELVVNNAVIVAKHFKVSETFISIAIIAVGTSLPEISTAMAAIKKNRINIAVGNLVGSNMFNTLFVVGCSALIKPIHIATSTLIFDALVFVIVCLTLRLFTKRKPEITAMEGFTLLSIYIGYMAYVLYRH